MDIRVSPSPRGCVDDHLPDMLGTVNRRERDESAALLRCVLDAVDSGELAADGPAAVAVVRRLEGALLALEAIERVHQT